MYSITRSQLVAERESGHDGRGDDDTGGIAGEAVHFAVDPLLPPRLGGGVVSAREGPAAGIKVCDEPDRARVADDEEPGELLNPADGRVAEEIDEQKQERDSCQREPDQNGSIKHVLLAFFFRKNRGRGDHGSAVIRRGSARQIVAHRVGVRLHGLGHCPLLP